MSNPDQSPRVGMVVERIPGQQQMVIAVYPPQGDAGIPWRVQLGGDQEGSLLEWPWLVESGYVVTP